MTKRTMGRPPAFCAWFQLRWISEIIWPRYSGSQKLTLVVWAPVPPPPVERPASFDVDPVSTRAWPGRTCSPVVGGAGLVDGDGCFTAAFGGVGFVGAGSTMSGAFGAGGLA